VHRIRLAGGPGVPLRVDREAVLVALAVLAVLAAVPLAAVR
jgi:hypothetical protein